jgi:hypothetical protein
MNMFQNGPAVATNVNIGLKKRASGDQGKKVMGERQSFLRLPVRQFPFSEEILHLLCVLGNGPSICRCGGCSNVRQALVRRC